MAYIYLHLKGSKQQMVSSVTPQYEEDEDVQLTQMLEEMIDVFEAGKGVLIKQDDEFIAALKAHLKPTIVRLKNGLKITNPLLEEIKKTYRQLYEQCLSVADILARFVGRPIPEAEVGYLAIHFGAALTRAENMQANGHKVRIGVVCASGIGISQLMVTRLKYVIKGRGELLTYGKADLTESEVKNIDFFISSIPLSKVGREVLLVNPLLPDTDIEQIEKRLNLYTRKPIRQTEIEVRDDFSDQLKILNRLTGKIQLLIHHFQVVRMKEKLDMLKLISLAAYRSGAPGSDKSVIEVDPQKIIGDLSRHINQSFRLITGYQFALLHGRTDGVKVPLFFIIRNKDDTAFQVADGEVFSVVVMLLPDSLEVKENQQLLGYISASLVEDEGFLHLIYLGTPEEIKKRLEQKFKRFFYQYIETL